MALQCTYVFAPVEIASGCFNIQLGMTSAENMEKPKTKMFRDEFMFTYWGKVRKKEVNLCHEVTLSC